MRERTVNEGKGKTESDRIRKEIIAEYQKKLDRDYESMKKRNAKKHSEVVKEMLFNFAETGKAEGWAIRQKGDYIVFVKDVYDKNTGITSTQQVVWNFPITKADLEKNVGNRKVDKKMRNMLL